MIDNLEKEELLEKELKIDEQRIEIDEKRIRNVLFIAAILVLVVFVNLAIIYSFIFKPRAVINEKISKPSPITISPTDVPDASPTPSSLEKPLESAALDNRIKDYFISLGSGTATSSDWTDVGGLQASFDLGSYVNVKEIRFEVSTQVATGNQTVWIRLYNKTDNHPVWNSDVTAIGASDYSVSEPIVYDKGQKNYQVQMKTQLNYPANITQSRLHIILQ